MVSGNIYQNQFKLQWDTCTKCKVRQNIQSTKVVTTEEIMDENKDKIDPSEKYLLPRKIKNRDHFVQIMAVKFEDLKGMISISRLV